ncbi:rRNA-processing protein [Coemansia javaensis]|uniref:rRNA-processing protein n=1 Tax=Coemansia javaensis TaxID=2761396 RepID=A0A9W8HCR6_9FUNG|nr:rRNA-processing protein [Coemansia javaensis]
MISSLAWVRKGAAAERPRKFEMTEDEYKRLKREAAAEIKDAKAELRERTKADDEILNDPALKEFDLEHYDDDEEGDGEKAAGEDGSDSDSEGGGGGGGGGGGAHLFSNIKGLSFYGEGDEDPHMARDGEGGSDDDDDDDEEAEEERLYASDNLLLVARTEDDISNIEVCVYEGEEDNLFVHHDFMLPAFPLALEWLDYRVGRSAEQGGSGNFVAVGTFEPRIEIWDLDTMDATYPDLVLGAKDKKALRRARGKAHSEFHTDAVMGLSWNRNVRNLLASSSADKTAKLWDLNAAACVQSYGHHSDKVQAVQWHPSEASVMLTGAYDRRVAALDSRAPAAVSWWAVDADVEGVMWDVHSPSHFYVATESGAVRYFDVRAAQAPPVYTLVAHDESVSAMDQHPAVRGLLVTGSADETVKVWDTRDAKPSLVVSRNPDVGSVFAARFCPDEPMLVALAGSNGESRIWDMSTNASVRAVFGDAAVRANPVREKPMVRVQGRNDGEDDDDDVPEAVIAELRGGAADPGRSSSEDEDEDEDDDDDDDDGDGDVAMEPK